MSTSSYGYASQVGEWFGSLTPPERSPIEAVEHALDLLGPHIERLHRPRLLRVSWAEYDSDARELAFHELDEYSIAHWEEIAATLRRLARSSQHRFAISCLFVDLDTEILEPQGPIWKPRSAELQLSIAQPELEPSHIAIGYVTYLDAWLSRTYGNNYAVRDNSEIATANLPRLECLLEGLRRLLGTTFRVGESQLYPFAITELGFRPVTELPDVCSRS